MNFKFFLLLFVMPLTAIAQDNIHLDEDFSDWESVDAQYEDASGDASGLDLKNLWITDDADFIYIHIELGTEINLQNDNNLGIYFDTDDNTATGFSIGGIGADLRYFFGERHGYYGSSQFLTHKDVGLISLPTVTSNKFELVFSKNATSNGTTIFSGNSVKVFLINEVGNGDKIPNEPGGFNYTFQNQTGANLPAFSITKPASTNLRVMSYNVLSDGLFESSRAPAFERILGAVHPDIIGFQEIYDHSSGQTAAEVADILSAAYSGEWYHSKAGSDIIAVSKYPITASENVAGNGAFLVDVNGGNVLLIVAHPPCCNNDADRQDEIDAMMAFVRNAKDGSGPFSIANETPIIIVGDMNLVGDNQQLTTFLTGDIVSFFHGPDFSPDWDGSNLEDAKPFTTGLPMSFTWYAEGSSFSPGRLDFMIFSGSVMELTNKFTLFTPALSDSLLTAHGLQSTDVVIASDHLPVIADFDLPPVTNSSDLEKPIWDFQVTPNPADEWANLDFELETSANIQIEIYNQLGEIVQAFDATKFLAGTYQKAIHTTDLPAGLYSCTIIRDGYFYTKQLTVTH